jgi:hypothetical protein
MKRYLSFLVDVEELVFWASFAVIAAFALYLVLR